MRILVNAMQYSDNVTGTDRTAHNLLRELQLIDSQNEYRVICMKGRRYIPDIINAPNFTIEWLTPYPKMNPLFWTSLVWRRIKRVFVWKPDLYFSFHNLQVPAFKYSKIITSDLDLIPLHFPEQYMAVTKKFPIIDHLISDRMREKLYRQELSQTAGSADHFMAISQFSKDDLVKYLDVDPDKITVAYLAAESKFRERASAETLGHVRERYHLPDRYILTLGSTEPRKNVRAAIEAYRRLPSKLREDYSLVIAGSPWHYVKTSDLSSGSDSKIHFTGYIDEEDLPALYQGAELFVFVSLYEGFGIPVLEAMASQVAVISSKTTSLPEVAGTAAKLIDPTDTTEISQAMGELLEDDKLRRDLVLRGIAQEKKFSWHKAARVYHEVFEKVLGQ